METLINFSLYVVILFFLEWFFNYKIAPGIIIKSFASNKLFTSPICLLGVIEGSILGIVNFGIVGLILYLFGISLAYRNIKKNSTEIMTRKNAPDILAIPIIIRGMFLVRCIYIIISFFVISYLIYGTNAFFYTS